MSRSLPPSLPPLKPPYPVALCVCVHIMRCFPLPVHQIAVQTPPIQSHLDAPPNPQARLQAPHALRCPQRHQRRYSHVFAAILRLEAGAINAKLLLVLLLVLCRSLLSPLSLLLASSPLPPSRLRGVLNDGLRICMHACMHTCMHACVRACVNACMRASGRVYVSASSLAFICAGYGSYDAITSLHFRLQLR